MSEDVSFNLASDDHNAQFARGAGCAFLTEPCLSHNVLLMPSGGRSAMFCNNTQTSSGSALTPSHVGCMWDRSAMGACSTQWAENVAPFAMSYFSQMSPARPNNMSYLIGTTPLVDNCPLSATMPYACSDALGADDTNDLVFGSFYGASSRCLDTGNIIHTTYSAETYAGTCLAVRCVNGTRIQFAVGGAFSTKWTDCPHDGSHAVVATGNSVYRGSVVCPPAVELCWDTTLFASEDLATTTTAVTPTTTVPTLAQTTISTTVGPATVIPSQVPATTSTTFVSTFAQPTTTTTTAPSLAQATTAGPASNQLPPSTSPQPTSAPLTSPPIAEKGVSAKFMLIPAAYTMQQLLSDIRAALQLASNPAAWTVTQETVNNTTVVYIAFQTSAERDTILGAVAGVNTTSNQSSTQPFSGVASVTAIADTTPVETTTVAPSTTVPEKVCRTFCPSTVTIAIICGGAVVLILIGGAIWWVRRKTQREIDDVHKSYSEEKLAVLRQQSQSRQSAPILVEPQRTSPQHQAMRMPRQMRRAPPPPHAEINFDDL
jgi:hypothetical protein